MLLVVVLVLLAVILLVVVCSYLLLSYLKMNFQIVRNSLVGMVVPSRPKKKKIVASNNRRAVMWLLSCTITMVIGNTFYLHRLLKLNDYNNTIPLDTTTRSYAKKAIVMMVDLNNTIPHPDTDTATSYAKKAMQKISSLRFDWTDLPPMTPLGKIIDRSQSQCRNESAVREFGPQEVVSFNLISSGMGSSLHTWVYPLCHASFSNKILVTGGRKWLWNDVMACPREIENKAATVAGQKSDGGGGEQHYRSALWCYFGSHESGLHCPSGTVAWDKPKVDFGGKWGSYKCKYEGAFTGWDRGPIFDAAAEWLFQNVSKLVIREAERQIREVAFPEARSGGDNTAAAANNLEFQQWPLLPNADSLITVHIRWGDKKTEMKLVTLEEYIRGTKSLLTKDEISGVKDVHVYVVTEDPHAVNQFRKSSPANWKIHSSGTKNPTGSNSMQTASRSNGRIGLESLAALLISLEANRYVLVSGSNWSRLIDELRKSVVDSRCGRCTQMIDLAHR